MNKNLVLLVVAAACMAAAVHAIVCTNDICDHVKCDNAETEENCNGVFKPEGGFCGCCPLCVKIIAAGEPCFSLLLGGFPPNSQCIDGTLCINGTCQTNC